MSMQEELRRCNYLGDVNSIYEFGKLAIVDHDTSISSISSMCMLNNGLNVKPRACVLFFQEIGLIDLQGDTILSRKLGQDIIKGDIVSFVRKTAELTLNFLLDNDYVSIDSISYDISSSKCLIKKSAFPLSAAVMRNYLIDAGMLNDYSAISFELQDDYERFFEESIRLRRSALSLEGLKEKQLIQEEQGRRAEEYVVEFEKRRLSGHNRLDRIRQISDFDVTAGFDIVSYETVNSECIDRFIEVKSYHNRPHFFWSANECEQAKIRSENYYLYLVDMEKYTYDDYQPIIIKNPVKEMFEEQNWIVQTASYEITSI